MTSPDPAASQPSLAERLRTALPPEQQHRADELAAFIAALPPERADATLRAAYPDLAPLLTPLIRVGDNAQIGDLTLGDLAGRDIVKPTIILAPDEVSAEAQRRRSRLLEIVGIRVQQGLADSLTAAAQLELGLTTRPDAVPLAPGLRLQQRAGARALPAGTTVAQVFDQAGGRLLILGAPGGGKSTLLLHLAAVLLDRASRDPAQPIPTLFNLSSWAAEGKSLAAWLVTALGDTYRIPKKIAEELVQRGRLALLLDGLDEVDPARRDACVQAINDYQGAHLTPLAVCSRTEEYGRLAGQLELEAAIELRPLSNDQVNLALSAGSDRLAGLRAAWAHDADLRDLLRTPLLLNVATLAYSDAAPTDTDEPWSLRLFPAFVERALRRRGDAQRYDHAKTLHWLRWLAQTLEAQQLSELYLERMQPGWLQGRSAQAWRYVTGGVRGVALGSGMFILAAAILYENLSIARSITGATVISFGVFFLTLIFSRPKLSIFFPERLRWSRESATQAVRRDVQRSLGLFLGAGIFMSIISGAFAIILQSPTPLVFVGGVALFLLFSSGITFANAGWESEYLDQQFLLRPYDGLVQSLKATLWASLVLGGSIGLAVGLFCGGMVLFTTILATEPELIRWLLVGVGAFTGVSLGVAMISQKTLSALYNYTVLRIVIAIRGLAPLRYVAFLDYSVALLLLRRVGGGYAFQHRLLRDYIGALSDAEIADLAARAWR